MNVALETAAASTEALCDPVSLEVIRGALKSSQKEMEALIERTAMSGFIREKKDFFVALFDHQGDLIVGAYRPSFGDPVRPVFDHYPIETMQPGDLYWYNDCYGSKGAVSHTPDQMFVSPIFVEGEIIAFAQSWAHFADVGGMRPGSISPDCTDIFQEGVIIPPVRLARDGVVNEELMRIFQRNTRFPEMLRGDMRACIADAFVQLADRSEQHARKRLAETFPPGKYQFADALDHDGQGNGPYWLRMGLDVTPEKVTLDFSASDDQATFALRIDGVKQPAWGVKGGLNGGSGRVIANPGTPQERELEPCSDGNVLKRGDVLRLETGGGGGWGHPFDRPADMVLADVLNGYVSPEAARRDYGIALSGDGRSVNETERLRADRSPADGLFHRHTYRDVLEQA